MNRATVVAIAAALASGVAAFVLVTHYTKADSALPPGNGDEGERLSFECIANPKSPPGVTVHFDTLKAKVTARCTCAAIAPVMQALKECCEGKATPAQEAACEDRTSFAINCSVADSGGLAGSGVEKPTLRVGVFGGFTRSNWECKSDEGKPNPDLEQMRAVNQSCCHQ
jgi:hypothetical protein